MLTSAKHSDPLPWRSNSFPSTLPAPEYRYPGATRLEIGEVISEASSPSSRSRSPLQRHVPSPSHEPWLPRPMQTPPPWPAIRVRVSVRDRGRVRVRVKIRIRDRVAVRVEPMPCYARRDCCVSFHFPSWQPATPCAAPCIAP